MSAPFPPSSGVELQVRCTHRRASGKRAQTYWFTFAVEGVLAGTFGPSNFTTQEMPAGRGGNQLMTKLGCSGDESERPREATAVSCEHRGVAKLVQVDGQPGAWRLLWIAREGDEASMRALEKLVDALIEAVEQRDLAPIRPYLRPRVLSAKQLQAIAKVHDRAWPGPFARMARLSLLHESDGQTFLGDGLLSYTFTIARDVDGAWRISALETQ